MLKAYRLNVVLGICTVGVIALLSIIVINYVVVPSTDTPAGNLIESHGGAAAKNQRPLTADDLRHLEEVFGVPWPESMLAIKVYINNDGELASLRAKVVLNVADVPVLKAKSWLGPDTRLSTQRLVTGLASTAISPVWFDAEPIRSGDRLYRGETTSIHEITALLRVADKTATLYLTCIEQTSSLPASLLAALETYRTRPKTPILGPVGKIAEREWP